MLSTSSSHIESVKISSLNCASIIRLTNMPSIVTWVLRVSSNASFSLEMPISFKSLSWLSISGSCTFSPYHYEMICSLYPQLLTHNSKLLLHYHGNKYLRDKLSFNQGSLSPRIGFKFIFKYTPSYSLCVTRLYDPTVIWNHFPLNNNSLWIIATWISAISSNWSFDPKVVRSKLCSSFRIKTSIWLHYLCSLRMLFHNWIWW